MQRTSVLGKKLLRNGLVIFKKEGKVNIVPKFLFQSNPFLTRRLMTTGTLKKPGANSQKKKMPKEYKNAISVVIDETRFSKELLQNLPWLVTQSVSKELKITEIFEEITSEGKLIEEKDKTENLKKLVDALNNAFEKSFGTSTMGIMKKFMFYSMIKDPSKLGELIYNIISVKNSFSGYYNLMNRDLRTKSKGIKTGDDEHSDHGIAVSDVGLKLIIQTLQDQLPSLEEFEEIYKALNDKSNRRAIPSGVHKIISKLESHELDSEQKRMVSIEEKLKKLTDEDREKLNTYLKKFKKNFGKLQEEYCENFISKLSGSKSGFVKTFAVNFNDFYINHVLYKVQKGGGFNSEEETILVFLLHLLNDQPTIDKTNENVENNTRNENEHEQVVRAYNKLYEIKKLMNGFFDVAKDIYKSSSNDTNEDILKRYDNYIEFKFEKGTEPSRPTIELKGGKTRKVYRRRSMR